MEYLGSLFDAFAFLILAVTAGGVVMLLLALIGVYPIRITNRYFIFTQDKKEEVLHHFKIEIGENSDSDDAPDWRD